MTRIRNPRALIDRKALVARLEELAGWSGWSAKTRPQVLDIFKEVLASGRAEVRRRFEEDKVTGPEATRAQAYLMDQLIRTVLDFSVQHVYPVANPTKGEQLSAAAIGGYGRGELAPFSDIDLMFILPYKSTPHTEQVVEFILYMLWDLGLKVGHSTRSVDDVLRLARSDQTIRTSVLEARWLWGDDALFKDFKKRFQAEIVATTGREFVESKLGERDSRHSRMGDTRYVLEPNIKEGKGGLRDLQTLFWIAKYLYQVEEVDQLVAKGVLTPEDARRFAKAETFLWTVRCHLHYVAGRPEERLTFNVQEEIGRRMGYRDRAGSRGVERFMKHYFLVAKDVGDLTRILCAVLEEDNKKRRFKLPGLSFLKRNLPGLRVAGGRVSIDDEAALKKDPLLILRLFHEAQRLQIDIHPHALRMVTQNLGLVDARLRDDGEANRLFLEMLCDLPEPEEALKRLNEADVFGRFIPDFGRVVAQMQYDMYHVYTVDEHTIRAIGVLSRIASGAMEGDCAVACEAIKEIESLRALSVAVLLHDIAKGRGGDHSELGAQVARKLGPRLGLTDWEIETVSWLVLHHLVMSATAFKRDISDAKTIADFVERVQSPERLRMLLVLTVADIMAVGPNVWNSWKGNLLKDLYYESLAAMTGGLPTAHRSARVEQAKLALRARLESWAEADVERHLALGNLNYWLSFDTATHVQHAGLVRRAAEEGRELLIESRADVARDATEVIIYAPDHPGLFAQIAGAMALGGANIVEARITTLNNGMALDTFLVQDAGAHAAIDDEPRMKRLCASIESALSGTRHLRKELAEAIHKMLPSRTQVFTVPPRVLVDNEASRQFTVIEVNGRDRPGFLYDVTRACTDLGLQIASARISTYGERAVDVFYVKDVYGLKVDGEEKLERIRKRLLLAVAPEA
ncbi:MAG: [protein-PII] uridylyltransferase [Magnetospirillum sp. WYHS-4]